jgi:hypothetical protein
LALKRASAAAFPGGRACSGNPSAIGIVCSAPRMVPDKRPGRSVASRSRCSRPASKVAQTVGTARARHDHVPVIKDDLAIGPYSSPAKLTYFTRSALRGMMRPRGGGGHGSGTDWHDHRCTGCDHLGDRDLAAGLGESGRGSRQLRGSRAMGLTLFA